MCYNSAMQKMINFDSGLSLALSTNPAVRSVAVGVFVGAGVVNETPELSGISHFIEHMVFKGTKKRSSFDIVNELDSVGAQINAFTAKSYTCFHTVSLDEHLNKCMDVLSDLYFDPTFDEEELEKERRVVIEEINESEDTPDDVCLEKLFTAFFAGGPLEKPILGSKQTLSAMTGETLRRYHQKYYVPSNTVITIAGNVDEKEAVEAVQKYFESRMKKSSPEQTAIASYDFKSVEVYTKKQIEQSHIAIAFPSYRYNDPRSYALQLMTMIFSMEMSSRLFQRVREQLGLCYSIVGYPSSYRDAGAFSIYCATSPKMSKKAVEAIREEICRLKSDGVSDEELEKGKQQLKTSLVLGQESTASMMRAFGAHAVQTGELYDIDARISAIDKVTKEDVKRVANEVFDFDKVSLSTVSPKFLDGLFDAIKFDAIK